MYWRDFVNIKRIASDDKDAFAMAKEYILSGTTDWINWDSITLIRILSWLVTLGYEITIAFICAIDTQYVIDYLRRIPIGDNERMKQIVERRIWEWEHEFPLIFKYFTGPRNNITGVYDRAFTTSAHHVNNAIALFRYMARSMI